MCVESKIRAYDTLLNFSLWLPTVRLWPVASANPVSFFRNQYDFDRQTKADGTFEFELPPGEYFVAPALAEFGADNLAELLTQLRSVAQRVTLRANQTATVELSTQIAGSRQ